jgi:hypothetical protein
MWLPFYGSEIRRASDIHDAAGECGSSTSLCDERTDRENNQVPRIFIIAIGSSVEKSPENNRALNI